MSEAQFITEIANEADCNLLLDVNNLYVNSRNHVYDPYDFLNSVPLERITAIHVAGHEQRYPDLIIDTHGSAIVDPVYDLLGWVMARVGNIPVLLERDFNFPKDHELVAELARVREVVRVSKLIREVA